MIYSMTGFGKAEVETASYRIVGELKTLNSKAADVSTKLPKVLNEFDLEIRSKLSERLVRGKLSLLLEVTELGDARMPASINKDLAKKYFKELNDLAAELGVEGVDMFRQTLTLPNVIENGGDTSFGPEFKKDLFELLDNVMTQCEEFRAQEGASIEAKFVDYVNSIEANLEKVIELDPERMKRFKERMKENLVKSEVAEVDQNRFEQELIYYMEKIDVSEEITRLRNHISYFRQVMNESGPHGKKLNFVSQEMGREINTIGSKANDADIQKVVVQMKDELEKIKEQTANAL